MVKSHRFVTYTIPVLTITLSLIIAILVLISIHKGENINAYALNETNFSDFNFAAVGDWGCTAQTKKMVDNIANKNPELVLGLGDYSYSLGAACWLQLIEPISEKMKIAIGNHEHLTYTTTTKYYSSPERLQDYMNYFNLSSQFYSFSHQNVHFIAMSTEVPYDSDSKQYNFVKNDLQKTVSNESIDWIVVFYHRVAYTSPNLIGPIAALRDTYHPLFEKYGVDLVIQAHAHNYQRTYPIKFNPENAKLPIITEKNATSYHNPKGQIYAIVGTGGSLETHNFTGPVAPYTAVQFTGAGFLNIDVLQNGTSMEGIFYENSGMKKDHFSIVKSKEDNEQFDSSSPSSLSSSSSSSSSSTSSSSEPELMKGYESKFGIETVVKGLRSPSDIAFLGSNDILVLEKNKGTVQRLVEGQRIAKPLLDTSVSNNVERGLLGIAVSSGDKGIRYVYLYYTEANNEGDKKCPESNDCHGGIEPW